MSQSTIYTETGYEVRTFNETLVYSYASDEEGNTTESINGMSIQSAVDSNTNTTTIKDGNGVSVMTANHVHDVFGRLKNKSVVLGNTEVVKEYSYNVDSNGNTGNLVSNYTTSYFLANDDRTQLSFSYSYDGNGNITDIARTENTSSVIPTPTPVPDDEPSLMILGGNRIVTSYTYDAAGQLLEAIDGETDHIYRYAYDNCGNIRIARTYVYDEDGNEVLVESKTFGYNNGILASYTDGTSTVTYQTDAMGNPIRISGSGVVKTLNWGEGRMLLEVCTDASNYSQYTYDVDGLRTRKIVAVNGIKTTTEYAWGDNGLAGTIIRDETATTTVVPHYDGEGEAIGFTVKRVPSRLSSPSTTNTYTYVKNLQGDVLRILDSNGNAVVNYTYDPWGKPTVTGDEELAALNPCSYRGYDYDEETGYYYLQSRYYDSQISRFINADDVSSLSTGGNLISCNLFAYCVNNPTYQLDENGYLVVSAVIGATVSAVATYLLYWLEYKLGMRNWNWWVVSGQIAVNAVLGAVKGALFGGGVVGKLFSKLIKMSNLAQKAKLTGKPLKALKMLATGTTYFINSFIKPLTRKQGESWSKAVKRWLK